MGDRPTPAPLAQGTLEGAPFAQLLMYVHRKELSGTLVLWPDREKIDAGETKQDRVLFDRGFPIRANLIESASALDRGLLPLFHRVDAPYAFYDIDLVGQGYLRGRVDPIYILNAAMRGSPRPDAMQAVIERVGEHRVRWVASTPLSRFGFDSVESTFIELLRATPASVPELIEYSQLGARAVHRILYVLTLTKSVDFIDPATEKRLSSQTGMRAAGRQTENLLRTLIHRRSMSGELGAARNRGELPDDVEPPNDDEPPADEPPD